VLGGGIEGEGDKWTPIILAQSVRSMSGSRGAVIFFEQTRAVKNYFLSFALDFQPYLCYKIPKEAPSAGALTIKQGRFCDFR